MTDENMRAADAQPVPDLDFAEETDRLEKRLEGLRLDNEREIASLMQTGAVVVSPAYLIRLRLDMFIQFIFTRMGNVSDEVRRLITLQFEVSYEETVADQVNGLKAEVRKTMMGLGTQMSESDIKQMWQRTQGRNGGSSPFSG